MVTQACMWKMDSSKMLDDIQEGWDRYSSMRPKTYLDASTVAAFAVTSLCHNPWYETIMILYPDMADVALASLKVAAVQYYWDHVKHSRTPQSPRRRALDMTVLMRMIWPMFHRDSLCHNFPSVMRYHNAQCHVLDLDTDRNSLKPSKRVWRTVQANSTTGGNLTVKSSRKPSRRRCNKCRSHRKPR